MLFLLKKMKLFNIDMTAPKLKIFEMKTESRKELITSGVPQSHSSFPSTNPLPQTLLSDYQEKFDVNCCY